MSLSFFQIIFLFIIFLFIFRTKPSIFNAYITSVTSFFKNIKKHNSMKK